MELSWPGIGVVHQREQLRVGLEEQTATPEGIHRGDR